MESIWQELRAGWPDEGQIARVLIRLLTAMLVGALIGVQRERSGKHAGLRTHMLVTLGAALFIIIPLEIGMSLEGLSRVIQGVATGIGFIGAGAILKLSRARDIQGLTTASGIWMTAAIGVAAGVGRLGLALVCAALTWLILTLVGKVEDRLGANEKKPSPESES
jgi:putative Mg2+ transporter-C (MgtC) family protein